MACRLSQDRVLYGRERVAIVEVINQRKADSETLIWTSRKKNSNSKYRCMFCLDSSMYIHFFFFFLVSLKYSSTVDSRCWQHAPTRRYQTAWACSCLLITAACLSWKSKRGTWPVWSDEGWQTLPLTYWIKHQILLACVAWHDLSTQGNHNAM